MFLIFRRICHSSLKKARGFLTFPLIDLMLVIGCSWRSCLVKRICSDPNPNQRLNVTNRSLSYPHLSSFAGSSFLKKSITSYDRVCAGFVPKFLFSFFTSWLSCLQRSGSESSMSAAAPSCLTTSVMCSHPHGHNTHSSSWTYRDFRLRHAGVMLNRTVAVLSHDKKVTCNIKKLI